MNPLASEFEVKAAIARDDSSAPLRAELQALRKQTAELQALKAQPGSKMPSRRMLKAQRDAIQSMIESVEGDLGMAAPAAASSPAQTRQPDRGRAAFVIQPQHIEHMQAQKKVLSMGSKPSRRHDAPSLEQYRADRVHAPRTPPGPADVGSLMHGAHRHGVFAQSTHSQHLSEEGASPTGKRRAAPPL